MSTKTTIKRIALVAASALAIGGFSAVSPASASTWSDDDFLQCSTAAVSTATGYCVTTVGSQVKISNRFMDFGAAGWDNVANGTYAAAYLEEDKTYYIQVTGASIQSVKENVTAANTLTTNTAADLNATAGDFTIAYGNGGGTSDADGLVEIVTDATAATDVAAGALDIYLTSAVAADATITVFYYGTGGAKTTVETSTITWAAASGAASYSVSATNSSIGVVGDTECTVQASPSAAKAALTTNAETAAYYVAGVSADLCVYTFDGLGNKITPASVVVFATKGFVQTSGTNSGTGASATIAAPGAGWSVSGLKGDSLQKGATTITAIVTDALGGVITLSTPFIWSGKLASLTLANNTFAATGVAANADAITVVAKDSDGNKIPQSLWTDAASGGLVTTSITDGATDLLVASDNGAGTAGTAQGDNNAYATVAVAGADATAGQTSNGSIDVTCAAAKYETISVTLYGYDSVASAAAGTAKQTIKSNTVTFACVESTASKITVTPAATSVDAGSTTTVNVKVLTASGRPVADGTTITLAASNGSVVAPNSVATVNGSFEDAANVITSNQANSTIITAISGATTGTATVELSGGSGEASSLALDAANAATDAANNAYDEAQNATQAASDALAAVTALAAQVKSLIASVKKLTAAVAKLKK